MEPALTTFVGFVVVAWLVEVAATAVGKNSEWLWWLWVVVLVRLVWRVLDWRNEWFVATDKRMLLLYGLITKKVSMMPLVKLAGHALHAFHRGPSARIRRVPDGVRRPGPGAQQDLLGRQPGRHLPTALRDHLHAHRGVREVREPAAPSVAVRRPAPAPVATEGWRGDRGVAWPPIHEVRPDDTQPIRIPPRRTADVDRGAREGEQHVRPDREGAASLLTCGGSTRSTLPSTEYVSTDCSMRVALGSGTSSRSTNGPDSGSTSATTTASGARLTTTPRRPGSRGPSRPWSA